MAGILERKDVDAKYKWDLSGIYESRAAFDADYKKCEKLISTFAKHKDTISSGAKELYAALTDMVEIDWYIEKLWVYSSLNFAVNMQDGEFQALNTRVRNLAVKAGESTWFVSPYMLKLDQATLDGWFAEVPELETYRRLVEMNMRRKPHTLSDECEMLMSKLEDIEGASDETRSMFVNSDLRFGKIKNDEGKRVELTGANYSTFLMSQDRQVRRAAFREMYAVHENFGNTFATMFARHVKERCTLAKARNYKDSITASTFRDEVTPEIYNNLIDTVSGGLAPLYDYYELKREVLGLDKLHLYDVYPPLISELDRVYPYEEAVDEVIKTVSIYGEEYADTLKAGLTERGWVDVYPTRAKRGGAFSSGAAMTEPYILLNYTDTYNDVSTLAHEAGHSMHSYFSRKYNEPHNSQYTIFVAEVASTVNELLLHHRKLRESDTREEKLYILNELMETYKGTLYRQTMFAEFERDMHKMTEDGIPLTRDVICKHYYKLVKKYFGKDVVCDKQIAYEWARIPHFYTSFYVYKYATCISAASAIVKRIETEGEAYVKQYIDFLKCGGSKSPLESLKVAGIDMTDPAVVEGAINDFAAAVKEFRAVYNGK